MICAHFACYMHCISDARMRSKLGYKQASLLSYHGVCYRRNRCLICIECCVCDCVLSSLSLSLSWCMQQKKQMRILHRMWLLHSDVLLCHVFCPSRPLALPAAVSPFRPPLVILLPTSLSLLPSSPTPLLRRTHTRRQRACLRSLCTSPLPP